MRIAKRGLVLLGGRRRDENIQPFPLNRPRAWEEELLLAHEKPQEKGVRAMMSSPMARLAGIGLVGVLVCGLAAYGILNPRSRQFLRAAQAGTAGPSPTFTLTPTFVNATAPVAATQSGPTPLAVLVGVSYSPTPLVINTPRSPLSAGYLPGRQSRPATRATGMNTSSKWSRFKRPSPRRRTCRITSARPTVPKATAARR